MNLVLLQTGKFGGFTFMQVLQTLTASLTLLAMSTLCVDFIALNVLRNRETYREAKVEHTGVFRETNVLPDGWTTALGAAIKAPQGLLSTKQGGSDGAVVE